MRALLMSTSALAVLAGSAFAADMPIKMPIKAPIVAPGYSWAGFYLGVNGGYSVGRNPSERPNFTNPAPGAFQNTTIWNLAPAGWVGGIQAGYNWQFNNLVVGWEADIQATGQKDSVCLICVLDNGALAIDQKMPWFGTVRGRLGWAAGPVLSYVTGGWAYGRIESDISLAILGVPTTGGSTHENKSGWTVGSGIEAAIVGNWTAKVEYLYMSLGSTTIPFFNSGTGNSRTSLNSDIRDHIIRVGLNYRAGSTSGTGAAASAAVPFGNWSGFYAGVNGGRGVGRNPSTLATTALGAPLTNEQWKQSPAGWLGGVQAGYNWQTGNVVLGLEADIQGSRLTDSACLVICPNSITDVVDQKISWFGTARARLGYAAGPALFYVTGGLAYGKVETTITNTFPGVLPTVIVSTSSTKSGWTFGGGAEVALAANWSARTEYLYMDLGSTSLAFTNSVPGLDVGHTFSSDIRTHIFRGGLNYHFNSPVVAKY